MTTDPALLAERLGAVNEAADEPGPPNYSAPNYSASNYSAPNYSAPNYSATNYNVAPTATIATVVSRHRTDGDRPTRRIRLMRWGLVPPWTKAGVDGRPDTHGPLLINARAEKATTSPAFRSAARHRRCLIPMDGFYEWRVNPDAAVRRTAGKTPFYIHRDDGDLLFMAGLWSVWRPERHPDAPPLLSCTIITTDAVGQLAGIHDRMPLIVPANRWDDWLDPDAPADADLLAGPPDVADLRLREVAPLVNSVRNNGPELIAPATIEPEQPTLL